MIAAKVDLIRLSAKQLRGWLHYDALPIWKREGFHGKDGGFSEAISVNGKAVTAPCRGRVPPRQIYCFSEAGRRGWHGEWRTPVLEGLAYFDRVYRLPSRFYGALATREGTLIDGGFDLYNQAFAILAFAHVAKALPETTPEMSARASSLLLGLKSEYAHSYAGFEEATPARGPLRSNPHMHLFEAALACEELEDFDRQMWLTLADEIAHLCMTKFIDVESGGLREFFDGDWRPRCDDSGRILEPGHQFEWAWLLARWAERRGSTIALAKAKRLFDIGQSHGICAKRQVAVMALHDDFTAQDEMARLWPQAEWLKSAMRLAVLSAGKERSDYLASALRAMAALCLFLKTSVSGLWRDKLKPDGDFVSEPAPASSLYHIVGAIYEVEECLNSLS